MKSKLTGVTPGVFENPKFNEALRDSNADIEDAVLVEEKPKSKKAEKKMASKPTNARVEKAKEKVALMKAALKEKNADVKTARGDVKVAKSEAAPFVKALAAAERQLAKDLKAVDTAKDRIAAAQEALDKLLEA